ncbi:MAG: hypothetical protein ACUZ8H_05345 [Candidatus Anammoxibacter sp.]
MSITVTTKYDCGYEDIISFMFIMDAAKYGEKVAKNPPDKVVSIVLKGPEGEREFIS